METINYNLFSLKRELELKKQTEYSWSKIAVGSGIHRNTILNMANGRTRRVDLDIMERLVSYFADQGMPITVGDLFTVTEDDASTSTHLAP